MSLAGRVPEADPVALLGNFIPPPLFAAVSFESYQPDAQYPSQAAALAFARVFAQRSTTRPRKRLFRAPPPEDRPGLYLDGGFGVGKTHLLASIYRAWQGRKLFGTFVEYTNLVGLLGFAECVRLLSEYSLICIDEFELDDPGDTVLMSSLLAELVGAGVKLAATSNTLPDRLGEGRFAAEDFLREIRVFELISMWCGSTARTTGTGVCPWHRVPPDRRFFGSGRKRLGRPRWSLPMNCSRFSRPSTPPATGL